MSVNLRKMELVDSLSYKNFVHDIRSRDLFVDYVVKKNGIHTANNSVILILLKVISLDKTYIINHDHQDLNKSGVDLTRIVNLIVQIGSNVFVVDKKRFINLFGVTGVHDILIHEFQMGYEVTENSTFNTEYHTFIQHRLGDNFMDLNYVIPVSKHVESFEKMFSHFKESILDFESDYSFEKLNGVITETLSAVERNGIHIDVAVFNNHFGSRGVIETEPMVYSEYNIFTSTGRPSNRFSKVNYSALNKDDHCRKSFTSRFGSDGMLLGFDYSAYHPHIVANLINFKLDLQTDFYDFVGKSYFKKDVLNVDDIKKSKNLTFQNFYGGIRDEYMGIDFFKKTANYIQHRWDFFLKNGYVETPVFKRRITENHISDPNPNKLFNYLLQASETEFSIQSIDRVNEFLKTKKSKVVLYTYDSILVDVSKDDGIDTLRRIKSTMIDNQFPVKCHAGLNYDELCEIKL